MAEDSTREFDIVVYGASGFVGTLLAHYLAEHAPPGTKIALAGRNREKLEQVRAQLPGEALNWPIILADASSVDALNDMARRTTVVATTVGPYAKYGLPVALACAEAGTHYTDLTGEVTFVRECIDACDDQAQRSGARIVNSCGFDSIPSDLGVYLTWEQAKSDGSGGLRDTTLVVRAARGGFSGGTIDSLRHQVQRASEDRRIAKLLVDPFALSPHREVEPPLSKDSVDKDVQSAGYDRTMQTWTAPFVMASYNTRIVRRSNALLGWEYGKDFHYQEVVAYGKSPVAAVMAFGTAVGLAGLITGMRYRPTRVVLDRFLPDPGEGPSEETREKGFFKLRINATTDSGAAYRTEVAANGDPGYKATSMMLGESALALALDGDRLPARAGVLTPAVAMGDVLIERLRNAGMVFDAAKTSD
jgi:short subunit dehydrogenase-like uncharacterized protein